MTHIRPLMLLTLAMVIRTGDALGGVNPNFTLPLHAKVSYYEACNGYLPVDCGEVRPTVEVESEQPVAVFLFVMNYTQVAGIQTAFEVDPSWTYSFQLWDCRLGEIADVNPLPPFGPTNGTLAAAFNCVTGGNLVALGRIFFVTGTGCIQQIESSFPYGIHAIDCQQQVDRIGPSFPGHDLRLGKICVGIGGHDGCNPPEPVASATWGAIKASYP